MKLIFSIILFLVTTVSYSQSSYNHVKHYANNTSNTPLSDISDSYILADDVLFRQGPGSDFDVVRKLSISSSIKLISEDTTTTIINGIKSNWYRAALPDKTTGYVWGGLVAQNQFGSSQPGGVKFLLGLEKLVTEPTTNEHGQTYDDIVFYTQIRAVKDGKEIAKHSVKNSHHTFDISSMESYGYGTVNLGQCGVEHVRDIIRLHVPCRGGCGCSTGDVFIAWNGTAFHFMAEAWGTADAQYSEGSSIVFPNAMGGEDGFIIKLINRIIWDESEEGTEPKDLREEFMEYYIWDGKKLQKTARRTESIITEIED